MQHHDDELCALSVCLSVQILYGALRELGDVDEAARRVTLMYRGRLAHKVTRSIAIIRRLRDAKAAYLAERRTEHVKLVWEADRKAEQEQYDKEYQEWLAKVEQHIVMTWHVRIAPLHHSE